MTSFKAASQENMQGGGGGSRRGLAIKAKIRTQTYSSGVVDLGLFSELGFA